MKVKSLSHVRLSDPMDCSPPGSSIHGLLHPWDFPGKSTEVGCHCLLGILRTASPQTICKIESQREFAEGRRELKPRDLCQARGVGWGKRWEGVSRGREHVYLWLIHVHVWQKLIQYCKAIILQLKKLFLNKSILKKKKEWWPI